jgi:hypothetical protein
MAQLPYSPFPENEGVEGSLPDQNINVIPAAFGSGIAQAAGKMGETLDRVSQQQFSTAMKLQEMQNETAANEHSTGYADYAANLVSQYRQKEGTAADQAWPQFQKDLQDGLQKYGQGLSPMARLAYERDSRSYYQRTITANGEYRDTQIKAANDSAALGSIKSSQSAAVSNYTPTTYVDNIQSVIDAATKYADQKGWGDHDDNRLSLIEDKVGQTNVAIARTLMNSGQFDHFNQFVGEISGKKIPGTDIPLMSSAAQTQLYQEAHTVQEMQDHQAQIQKKSVSDAAANEWTGKLFGPSGQFLPSLNGNYAQAMAQINGDERLTPEAKREMTNYVMGVYRDVILEPKREAREAITQERADERWDRQLKLQETAQDGQQRQLVSQMIESNRIQTPTDIYTLANEGQLSRKAVPSMIKELNDHAKQGPDPSDPTGEAKNHGYAAIKGIVGDDAEYNRAWFQLNANDKNARNIRSSQYPTGVPASERYDPASDHWIGKGVPGVDPKVPVPTTETNPSATGATAVPPPTVSKGTAALGLDNIPRGEKGSPAGVAAIKAALASGRITRDQAAQELLSRGWARPAAPKAPPSSGLPAVAPAQ